MRKKLLCMALMMSMTVGLLTGCGTSSKSAVKSGSDSKKNGPVEVEFWYSGGKTAVNVVADIVDEFNKSQSDYKVKCVTQADYDETYQKVQAGIAGGTAPDIALLDVNSSRTLNQKKVLEDISTYTKDDSDFNKDDYLDVFLNQGVDDENKTFAIPAYGTTQVLYYNKKAFKNAGIKPESIKTWQDLADASKKITEKNKGMTGWEPMWGKDNLVDAVLSNGGSLFSDDGKTVCVNSDAWVEVWDSFKKWIHDDKIMKIHSGGQGWEYWYTTIDDVLQNKAGGYTGSSGDQADLDFSIVGAMQQPGFGNNASAPAAEAKNLVILKNSSDEEKKGAYEFIKYFTTPENQAKWSMETGYVAVRKSTQDVKEFNDYTEKNPQAFVPLQQASHGSVLPTDPTGGKIYDALKVAADKVEIEGVSAKDALDEAQKTAEEAMSSVSK